MGQPNPNERANRVLVDLMVLTNENIDIAITALITKDQFTTASLKKEKIAKYCNEKVELKKVFLFHI